MKMINNLKKILILTLIVFLSICGYVKADEEDSENIDFSEIWNEYITSSTESSNEPVLNSRAAIVLDRKTGAVLFEKNAFSKRAMASTTKIMTAIIVLENCDLSENVKISTKAANTGGSTLGITAGSTISLESLMYGLLLRSRK